MKVLIVAPHADDETLAMGGTIARHVADGDEVTVAVMTGHGPEKHPIWPSELWEEIRAEARQAFDILGVHHIVFEELPAVMVADIPVWEVNKVTQRVLKENRPDCLYVPFPFDLHKDHREMFHSFSVAWCPVSDWGRAIREIYCYEVLSETHLNIPYAESGFLPNTWVDIGPFLSTKLSALKCFESQLGEFPNPRSLEAIEALARWRGSQAHMEAAEAFVQVRQLR